MTSPSHGPRDPLSVVQTGVEAAEAIRDADEPDQTAIAVLHDLQLSNELKRARIDDVKSDRELRKIYGFRILRFLHCYSLVVGILVLLSGLQLPWLPFELPSEVLALLVGSTAAAAIGLVGFVARGLFKTPPSLP